MHRRKKIKLHNNLVNSSRRYAEPRLVSLVSWFRVFNLKKMYVADGADHAFSLRRRGLFCKSSSFNVARGYGWEVFRLVMHFS